MRRRSRHGAGREYRFARRASVSSGQGPKVCRFEPGPLLLGRPAQSAFSFHASSALEKAEWGPVEIFGGDLVAEIAELKARDDEGTVLVHGGPNFAKSLTRLGLVDEYRLTTVPIAIGAGHSHSPAWEST